MAAASRAAVAGAAQFRRAGSQAVLDCRLTFESGQVFMWAQYPSIKNAYVGVVGNSVVAVRSNDGTKGAADSHASVAEPLPISAPLTSPLVDSIPDTFDAAASVTPMTPDRPFIQDSQSPSRAAAAVAAAAALSPFSRPHKPKVGLAEIAVLHAPHGVDEAVIRASVGSFLRADVDMAAEAAPWEESDPSIASITSALPGWRMLRQDPWECLISFLCSSNNNIARITQMLTKLRTSYGEELGIVDDVTFYSFPTVEALSTATEADLRALGLGYRARYVVETATRVKAKGGMTWLHSLRLQTRQDATDALTELTGVGPKVADCVALFSLDQHSCIPVDTHVWAIACREMDPSLREAKSITPKIYKRVGDLFRDRYGDKAGWAHCLLFIAELPAFRKLLPQKMQDSIEVFAKEERAAKALKKEAAKAKRQAKAAKSAASSAAASTAAIAARESTGSPLKRERVVMASAEPLPPTSKRDR